MNVCCGKELSLSRPKRAKRHASRDLCRGWGVSEVILYPEPYITCRGCSKARKRQRIMPTEAPGPACKTPVTVYPRSVPRQHGVALRERACLPDSDGAFGFPDGLDPRPPARSCRPRSTLVINAIAFAPRVPGVQSGCCEAGLGAAHARAQPLAPRHPSSRHGQGGSALPRGDHRLDRCARLIARSSCPDPCRPLQPGFACPAEGRG